jgi:hypothetical protein
MGGKMSFEDNEELLKSFGINSSEAVHALILEVENRYKQKVEEVIEYHLKHKNCISKNTCLKGILKELNLMNEVKLNIGFEDKIKCPQCGITINVPESSLFISKQKVKEAIDFTEKFINDTFVREKEGALVALKILKKELNYGQKEVI